MKNLENIAKIPDSRYKQIGSENPFKQVYQIDFRGGKIPEFIEEPLFLKLSGNTQGTSTNPKENISLFDRNLKIEEPITKDIQPSKIQAVPSLLLEDNAYPDYSAPLNNGGLPTYPISTQSGFIKSIFFNFEYRGGVKSLYFDKFGDKDFIGIKKLNYRK